MNPADRLYEDGVDGAGEEPEAEEADVGEEADAEGEEALLDADIGEPLHLPMLQPEGPPPTKRADCLAGGPNAVRPCGWITCKWYIHRVTSGAKFSCVLDVADLGGVTLEEVGDIMGITRERVRQIEAMATRKIMKMDRNPVNRNKLRELAEAEPKKEWQW